MSEEKIIWYGTLGFTCANFLWEMYLILRQHKVYRTAVQVPSELRAIWPSETFEKARLYGLDKKRFLLCANVYNMVLETCGIWWLDGMRHAWEAAGFLANAFGLQQNELVQSAVFVCVVTGLYVSVKWPINVYNTFVLEEKHGFNRQTVKFFIVDQLKEFVMLQALTVPFSTALVYIMRRGGDYFFLYLWLFTVIASIIGITIYPEFIAPLFDKYTPLPDGELKTCIEELAARAGFPIHKIYVVEGSKRSSHSNAYYYGLFGSKTIVLFDNLLKEYAARYEGREGCDNEEVVGILAHELGHWKLNHTLKNFFITQAIVLVAFVGFGALFRYDALYHAFGFRKDKPAVVRLLIVLLIVFAPFNRLLQFLMTWLSRRLEFQSDAFAKHLGLGTALRRALITIEKNNLAFPVYDRLYSMWNDSHPQLIERLKALDKDD